MDNSDITYLLGRCCSHRSLASLTASAEARRVHQEFVRRYQHRLLALRRARATATPSYQEQLAA